MSPTPVLGHPQGRGLLMLFGITVVAVILLMTYRLRVSHGEEIATVQTATRNYAAILEARLEGTLRRVDSDLKSLAGDIPIDALKPQAVPRHARRIDEQLDARLFHFAEIAGYRVTDARGDTLYTSSATPMRANVADRDYFQVLRDNPKAGLVFSEVVTGRTTGRRVIAVARALRDAGGAFHGIIYGILDLESMEKVFQSIDLGTHGAVSLRRSDNQALVLRVPALPVAVNQPLPAADPVAMSMTTGDRLATLDGVVEVDGTRRIVSIHALQRYPFYFVVGVGQDSALAKWRTRATVAVSTALLLLGLVAGSLVRLWRVREHEARILVDLSQNEERFRQMAEGIDQVFFKAAADYSSFDYISPAFDRIWGRSRSELMADPLAWITWLHPEDCEKVQRFIGANRRAERYGLEFRVVRADGEVRWIQAQAFRLESAPEGERVVGFHTDVTERKKAEESLEENREKYRGLSEASFDAIFISEKGICLEQNLRAEEMFGYTAAEAVGRPGTDWIAPEDREQVMKNMMSGYEQPYDVMALRKDGSRFPAAVRGRMMHYRGRKVRVTSLTDISERMQAEQALRESEAYNKILFAGSHIPLAVLDPETMRLVDCNQAAVETYGMKSREEVLAMSPGDVATPLQYDGRSSAETAMEHIVPALRDGSHVFEWRHQRPDGHVWDAEVHLMAFQYGGRTLLQFSLQDISARRRAEADLRIAATAFESQEGMIITDLDRRILRINRACSEITGYSAAEAIGQTPHLFSSGRHDEAFYREMWTTINGSGVWKGELWNRRKNGDVFPVWTNISAVSGGDGQVTHYVASFMDISQRKTAEDEIRHLAFYDPLTRLPNRRLLLDRLRHALVANSRSESVGALLFIDLDNFKTLNDTQGHDKGDQLLESVAQRLSASVREGDTVARLGGDEFVVMLEGLSKDPHDAAGEARLVGEKILRAFDAPHDLGELKHHGTASIGIAVFAHQTDTVDDLLKRADLAMYQAKAAGRNTLRFFDPEMQSAVMARAELESDLRDSLGRGQMILHYQPQVDVDGLVTGAEALVRWRHPARGLISPLEFISLAEDTGLILPIGAWVLETACDQIKAWSRHPLTAGLTLSVNVSARQFRHADFVTQVLDILDRSGAEPRLLKLELTESLLLEDVEEIIAKMATLKAEGVGFSLDDFGTGYSSLSYLKRLPLDQLKIDQSFVRDVLTDPNDAAIARTIVALGRSMGLQVIAEGVETAQQRDFLAGQGCRSYQGYLYGRPVPAEEFSRLIDPV